MPWRSSVLSPTMSPTTQVPVATPTRTRSRRPVTGGARPREPSTISSAARTARTALSSKARGKPKAISTPSPEKLETCPPWVETVAPIMSR